MSLCVYIKIFKWEREMNLPSGHYYKGNGRSSILHKETKASEWLLISAALCTWQSWEQNSKVVCPSQDLLFENKLCGGEL